MKLRSKLVWGVAVACLVGAITVKSWATPGALSIFTPVAGPAILGDVKTKSKSDTNEVEFETKGDSQVFVTRINIAPGGYGGWHWHPGPSILMVNAGEATFYQATDPTTPHVYETGDAFVEDAGLVHDVRNEGDTELELVVIQIVPVGAPRRIDAPAP